MNKGIIQQLLETEYSNSVSLSMSSSYPNITKIELGADNVLFNVENQYVVKLYPDKPTKEILQSVELMSKYNSRSIALINNYGEFVTEYPKGGNFIVMDFLNGEHPVTPIVQSKHKEEIISALKRIENFNTNVSLLFYNFYEQTLQRLIECTKFADTEDTNTINELIRTISPLRKNYLNTEQVVVSHHDFKPENIIFLDNKSYFLIDWDKAVRSYYLDDVVRTAFFFSQTENNIDSKSIKFFFDSFPQRWSPSIFLYSLSMASLDVFSEIYLCTKDPKIGNTIKSILPRNLQIQFLLKCIQVISDLDEKDLD